MPPGRIHLPRKTKISKPYQQLEQIYTEQGATCQANINPCQQQETTCCSQRRRSGQSCMLLHGCAGSTKGQIALAADMIANCNYGSALEAPTVQQHMEGHIKVASGVRSDVCAWHMASLSGRLRRVKTACMNTSSCKEFKGTSGEREAALPQTTSEALLAKEVLKGSLRGEAACWWLHGTACCSAFFRCMLAGALRHCICESSG